MEGLVCTEMFLFWLNIERFKSATKSEQKLPACDHRQTNRSQFRAATRQSADLSTQNKLLHAFPSTNRISYHNGLHMFKAKYTQLTLIQVSVVKMTPYLQNPPLRYVHVC